MMKQIAAGGILGLLALVVLSFPMYAGLFDERYPSARALSMGGSGVATINDVWAAYYNPASLSRIHNIQLGSTYLRLYNLGFFNNFFGAGVYPLPQKYGAVSLSIQYFGVNYQGEDLSSEYTFALSHGFFLLKDIHSSLAVGYSLKAYYWSLGTSVEGLDLGSSTTFGLDVGLRASVFQRTHIGFYFLNLNSPRVGEFAKFDLPKRVVAGIAYQPYEGVTTSLDFNRLIDANDTELWGGAEFQVFNYIFLRFGGTTNPNRFTAGIGLDVLNFNIDYGLRTHSELGETHSFGLIYRFK